MYIPHVEQLISDLRSRVYTHKLIIEDFQWRNAGFKIMETHPSNELGSKWSEVNGNLRTTLVSNKWEGRKSEDCSFTCLLFQDSRGKSFLTVLKIVDDNVRCVVQTDLDSKDLRKRLADKIRDGMEAESLDIVNKPLQGGNSVSVTMKKRLFEGMIGYKVVINIIEEELEEAEDSDLVGLGSIWSSSVDSSWM